MQRVEFTIENEGSMDLLREMVRDLGRELRLVDGR